MQFIESNIQSEAAELPAPETARIPRQQRLPYFEQAPGMNAHAVWGAQSGIGIYLLWAPAHVTGQSQNASFALQG